MHFDGARWTSAQTGSTRGLMAVWGSGPHDVWAVGEAGTTLHFDGAAWTQHPTGSIFLQSSIWGSGPNDVWSTAVDGLYHWDGSHWSQVATPALTGSGQALWGSAANDVWQALGSGKLGHFDGTGWSEVASPVTTSVNALWGSGRTDVWAVGANGVILHWAGTSWSQVASPTTQNLYGIFGTGPSNVWASGVNGALLHFTGAAWTLVPTPGATGLAGIWGSSASDVWVLGASGTLLHFDGTALTNVATAATTENLLALWGADSSDVWAVGYAGATAHFDGASWSSVPSPAGSSAQLVSLWGTARDDVYAAGNGGLLHWNGLAWRVLSPGVLAQCVWGTAPSDVWAIDTYSGLVARGRFATWSASTPYGGSCAIWGSGPNDVWTRSLANNQSMLHWNGTTWTTHSGGGGFLPVKLWGFGVNDIWGVGANGNIHHYDGAAWALTPSPTTLDLAAVWGPAPNDVWAAGAGGVLLHWNGTSWSQTPSGVGQALTALWGSGADDVRVAGMSGAILRGPAGAPALDGGVLPFDAGTPIAGGPALPECVPATVETRTCGSSIGDCRPGQQSRTCDATGYWVPFSPCGGASSVLPSPEVCGNAGDEDCDGLVDEGCACAPAAPGAGGSFALAGTITRLATDQRRCRLYALNTAMPSELVVLDTAAKSELLRITLGGQATDVDISADGGWVVVSMQNQQLLTVNPVSLVVTPRAIGGAAQQVEVRDDGRAFYVGSGALPSLVKVELASGAADVTNSPSGFNPDLELAPGGALYVATSGLSAGQVTRYDANGTTLQATDSLDLMIMSSNFVYPVRHLLVSAGARHVYYGNFQLDGANLNLLRGRTGEKVFAESAAETFAVGSDHLFDAQAAVPIAALPLHADAAALAAADHELWTYSAATGRIYYRHLNDLLAGVPLGPRERAPRPVAQYTLTRLVANPVRPRLYGLDTAHGLVVVFDRTTLAPVQEIAVGPDPSDLAIDAAGATLFVGYTTNFAFARIDLVTETFDRFVPLTRLASQVQPLSGGRLATVEATPPQAPCTLREAMTGAVIDAPPELFDARLAASSDGTTLYVAGKGSGPLSRYLNLSAGLQLTSQNLSGGGGMSTQPRPVALPNGSGVFHGGRLLDGADVSVVRYALATPILAVTPDSRLALTPSGAIYTSDGGVASSTAYGLVFAPGPDSGVVYSWSASGLFSTPLP